MTITDSYFGAELTPIDIIQTRYGKIYVCSVKYYGSNKIVFYDKDGNDPMELSSIDIEEFEEIFNKSN